MLGSKKGQLPFFIFSIRLLSLSTQTVSNPNSAKQAPETIQRIQYLP